MQKIRPCLWFDNQAEAAAQFYLSVFKDGRVLDIMRCGEAGPGPPGSVLTVTFEVHGQEYIALNGGPHFSFNEAISLFVACEDQREIDELWEKLSEGGEKSRCGWLKDRFGVSWQVVPSALWPLLQDPDARKSARVMQALLQMDKLDIAALRRAYDAA